MPNMHTKVDGVWKKVNKVHVNVGGVWKPVKRVWVNVAGVWKVTHSSSNTNAFVFNHTISISTNNFNIKNTAIASGWNQTDPLQATVTINSGVVVTSVLSTGIAFDTGQDFPDGTTLTIVNNGHIRGKGGRGGAGSTPPSGALDGDTGGTALRVRYPTLVTNNGTIAGGGGGGGGGAGYGVDQYIGPFRAGGGGGGSGANGFLGGAVGTSAGPSYVWQASAGGEGTATTAGAGGTRAESAYYENDGPETIAHLEVYGGYGGAGGGLGQAGNAGTSGSFSNNNVPALNPTPYAAGVGGAAGIAVQGNSAITWMASGTRLGPINE